MDEVIEEFQPARRRLNVSGMLDALGPLLALLLLVGLVAWLEQYRFGTANFLKLENWVNIVRQWSFVGIIAVGMTIVIISGGIDLSVGALVALAGGLGIWVMNTSVQADAIIKLVDNARKLELDSQYGDFRYWLAIKFTAIGIAQSQPWGVSLAITTTILTGTLAGFLNGLLIAKGRLAPFIATLGGLAAYRSLALAIADGGEFRSGCKLYGNIGAGGPLIKAIQMQPDIPLMIPYPSIALLIVALIGWVLLNRTRFGRYVFAIGCNERAAIYSAINVDRIKIYTYTLIGTCCGLAAWLLSSRMNSVASSSTGNLYELDAIAAVVIGGTRMTGGAGRIGGTIIGVLILGVIGNALIQHNVSPYLQGLVKGAIIILAVLLQRLGRSGER